MITKNTIKSLLLLLTLSFGFISCQQDEQDPITAHIVQFDSNGGSVVADQEVLNGELVLEPTTPVKDGYDFTGWYLNDSLFDFSTSIESDLVLDAQWLIQAGDSTFTYHNISREVFEAQELGERTLVKAELYHYMASWAWGTEVYLVDHAGNSSKDLYDHSNFGMFSFPLTFEKGSELDGGTYVFKLVNDIYMSSPQLGFAYGPNDVINEDGLTAYENWTWNAPMRYGIEFFDEAIRGNVRTVTYNEADGLKVLIGTKEVTIKAIEEGTEATYVHVNEDVVALVEEHLEQNRYLYVIEVEGELVSVLNNGQPQLYSELIVE